MKLLLTGAWKNAKKNISALEEAGHSVSFLQFEKDEIPCAYEEIEGIVGNGLFLYHPIEKFTSLKYIQLTSAGFDRVPMDYVREHNIEIKNARGVYSVPMAEYALFGVLELYKKGKFFLENQKEHKWEKHRGLCELFGKTVCIVGCGSVGTECAKRFRAFGSKVTGVDIAVRDDENYDEMKSLEALSDMTQRADIVVLTLPMTEETKHIINSDIIETMKETALIVNISRGGVIDTEALIKALENKKIGGAVLDVFESEPLFDDSPLWDFENVIITPHNSFVGENNDERLDRVIMENMKGASL